MTWIIPALILFISSVCLYLLVRKNQIEKAHNAVNNLAMFAIPTLVFAGMNIVHKIPFGIAPFYLFIIFLAALFCSYLGGVFSLKGIDLAPNPGYSLIIAKSYVVFTSIVALVLFGAELTLKNALAIGIIVFFSAVITINRSQKKKSHYLWVAYSFGAFFAWGILALVSTWLIKQQIPVTVTLFWLSLFATLIILTEIGIKKTSIQVTKTNIILFVLIGIAATVFNLCMQIGYMLAPNPGYINAANASSISLLALLSHYFYKDELNIQKIIGIIGVTVGLIILFIK